MYGTMHRVVDAIIAKWKRRVGIDYAALCASLTPPGSRVSVAIADMKSRLRLDRRFWFQRPHVMWLLSVFIRATPLRPFTDLVLEADEGAVLRAIYAMVKQGEGADDRPQPQLAAGEAEAEDHESEQELELADTLAVERVTALVSAATEAARKQKPGRCAAIIDELWRAVHEASWSQRAASDLCGLMAPLLDVPHGGVWCALSTLYCAVFRNVRLEPGVAARALMAAIPVPMWQWLLTDAVARHAEGHPTALARLVGQVASTCTLSAAAEFWKSNLCALERLCRMPGLPAGVSDDLLVLRKQAFML